jgi:hypothetical protein
MVEGFTVKCNKCGKEKQFTEDNFMEEPICIYAVDYEVNLGIFCDCGNEVVEK